MTAELTPAPGAGPERQVLEGYLDHLRSIVVRKLDGLSEDEASAPRTASGLSLAAVVQHLGHMERFWFRRVAAGHPLDLVWSEDDPDADWRLEPGVKAADVLAFYESEVGEARAALAPLDLDGVATDGTDTVTVRWVLVHMIEETARHLGHLDLIREALDGRVGD